MRESIALITAIIALATGAVNLVYTVYKINEQEKEIERLKGCLDVIPNIDEPKDKEDVGNEVNVIGTSTIHDTCQYVFIITRDVARPVWHVSDLVQVKGSGQWAGFIRLNNIVKVGGVVEITVRVTARAEDYPIGRFLSTPPMKGAKPNDTIRVRRVQ